MALNLLSNMAHVETPFIIVTIGEYTFGAYSRKDKNVINQTNLFTKIHAINYPNYMKSLTVNKINGTVNTYTINMVYPITQGDDPNLLEKVFSSVSSDRTLKISYGDLYAPAYIYKEELAIITDIKSNFNLEASSISYTITCTSSALATSAGTLTFRRRNAKPSTVIKEILYDSRYGLLDIFTGMKDKDLIMQKGLIAGDDKVVTIEAQSGLTVFQYLTYLVDCMTNISDVSKSLIKSSKYTLTVYDDITGELQGPYFTVSKMNANISSVNSLTTYEVDIGTLSKDSVISFSIDNDETYAILYEYSNKIEQSNYIYRINENGEGVYEYSPTLSNSRKTFKTTEADKTWWTTVTQYPINAKLVLKGLLRPAILMSHVKVNIYFYGRKHIHSGTYIITKQTDQVDDNGYKTTLSLTRISSDTDI